MGTTGAVTTLVLFVLGLIAAVRLEHGITGGFAVEMLIIVVLSVFALVMLVGLGTEKIWGWPLATIVFSASTANLLWIYSSTGMSFTMAGGMLICTFGLLIGIFATGTLEEPMPIQQPPARPDMKQQLLETYSNGDGAAAEKTVKKKGSRKK